MTFNDTQCTYVSDDGLEYNYRFTMPEEDVILAAQLIEDFHPITPMQGEHTTLAILNCHYNQGTPEHIIQASALGLVRYVASAEIGYELTHFARLENGDRIPVEWKPDDEEYGACYRVLMPDEALFIETHATEKTTYAGKEFLGEYRGFELGTADRLVAGAAQPMTMRMKANTVFEVTTDDENAFAFDGCYKVDEATSRFDYIHETCKKSYCISGAFIDDRALVEVKDVVYGISLPTYLYFAGKSEYTYAYACDENAYRYLLEITAGGEKTYYIFERGYYNIKRAEVRFDAGTTIAEPSSALVAVDGVPLLRYTLAAADADPVFVKKGREAGTYTPAEGSGPTLTLDGFGNATLGDATGTYTLENGVVEYTAADGTTAKYLIDTSAMTYTRTQSVDAWDGPARLAAETDKGYNNGWVPGRVTLDMDVDFSGNPKPGYALLKMTVAGGFFGDEEITSDCVPYVYDPAAGTFVLSQVIQGKSGGWGQVRGDVALTVTDRKTLVFTTEAVYSTESPYRYMQVKDLELLPVTEP